VRLTQAAVVMDREMKRDYQKDLEMRLKRVDWSTLDTAYGSAESVPRWLWDLRFASIPVAEDAVNALCGALCHQKGQLGSAALEALPFLLEFLPDVTESLRIDILDILDGFALCSAPARGYPSSGYHATLRDRLRGAIPEIMRFATGGSADSRDFAARIFEELSDPSKDEPKSRR
jgi:hypothetical protein